MNLSLNRTGVVYLQNKSGGLLAQGDVAVVDASNALAVTTTNTLAYTDSLIVVVMEPAGIANNAIGLFAYAGPVQKINLSSSASLGDLISTSSTPGEGTPHAAPFAGGDFAQVLEAGATPSAILFGVPVISPLNDYILIVDEKSTGTDGGTFTSGAWQTRTLNTIKVDSGGNASLLSNQITLAPGKYRYHISCPAFAVDGHQAKLYNITDAVDIEFGTSMFSGSTDFTGNRSEVFGEFEITVSTVVEVQHQCTSTKATNGFGEKANVGSVEKYSIAEFWRIS